MKVTHSIRSLRLFSFAAAVLALALAGPAQANLLDGLSSYWQFEGGYTDSEGTNPLEWSQDGTATAPTFVTGQVGTAVSLDGSGGWNYLRTTGEVDASLLGSNARTLNVWFQTPSDALVPLVSVGAAAPANGELFEMLVLDSGAWMTGEHISWEGHFWGYTDDDPALFYETGHAVDDPVITVDTWYMATLVYDGNTSVQVYQDGGLVTDYTLPGPLNTLLGAGYDERRFLFGTSVWSAIQPGATPSAFLLDDLAMWNRALSADEVGSIYTAGQAGLDLYAIPEPSTVALYGGVLTLGLVMIRRRRDIR